MLLILILLIFQTKLAKRFMVLHYKKAFERAISFYRSRFHFIAVTYKYMYKK